jgi:hypothetical protein
MATPENIDFGPFEQVKLMLIADKVQNRFEFELNHNNHDNAERLAAYFSHWLLVLGIDEGKYIELSRGMIKNET